MSHSFRHALKTSGQQSRMRPVTQSLDKQLAAYSIAAACAGVALTSLAQPATHQTIQYFPANFNLVSVNRNFELFPFDIDRNGITDFNFFGAGSGYSSRSGQNASYQGVVGWSQMPTGAGALDHMLSKGMEIGPKEAFGSKATLLRSSWRRHHGESQSVCSGLYQGGKPYIGVKFLMRGETHYGWIRVSSLQCLGLGEINGYVTGYAYNTVANAPIQAGQIRSGGSVADMQGTLGMLSLGAAGRK